jgi:hypothetical protein
MSERHRRLSCATIAVLAATLAGDCRYGSADGARRPRGGVAPADVPAFPLKVADSGRYLVDQHGVPFLVNGDTPWSLTHNLSYDEAPSGTWRTAEPRASTD